MQKGIYFNNEVVVVLTAFGELENFWKLNESYVWIRLQEENQT